MGYFSTGTGDRFGALLVISDDLMAGTSRQKTPFGLVIQGFNSRACQVPGSGEPVFKGLRERL